MKDIFRKALTASAAVKTQMAADNQLLLQLERAAAEMIRVVKGGGTLYMCGNGGSACDAMHFCEELVARYKRERKGIRAVHFLDSGTMTCWANDYEYDSVFQRGVETFCGPQDGLVVFSTSGNSESVLRAVEAAKKKGTFTLALTGKDGGKVRDLADQVIVIPANTTERIQEAHITLVHVFCEIFDDLEEVQY